MNDTTQSSGLKHSGIAYTFMLSPKVATLPVITPDGCAASPRAVAKLKEVGTLPQRVCVRSSNDLNNVIEQDHCRIKLRDGRGSAPSTPGPAATTIRGIE
jgi:transposase-like protein